MSHLMIIQVGPVQEFIATARRSRDLWYGSWMLSELSKAAAKSVAQSGGRLIFPAPTKEGDLETGTALNAPNKVVAIVGVTPDEAANRAKAAIQIRLHELRDNAFEILTNQRFFDRALAEAQVGDVVEFYWVSAEFDSDSDTSYANARNLAEALLNARKTTRDFRAVTGDHRPKSSLDGARESVIDERAFAAPNASEADKEKKGKALFERFGARPAERLSGVDLLKRLGLRNNEPDFRSTSHMAALPFLKHVDKSGKDGNSKQLLDAIINLLDAEDVPRDESDGALVFSSRLTEWIPDRIRLEDITKKLDKLLQDYAGDTRPQPYYALLVADGDNMGAAIDNMKSEKDHCRLSQALSKFALEVDGVVKQHVGVLVYSGGDDVMAYLPLHTVLACANSLAEMFAAAMSEFTTAEGRSPTLSTGIVVAHHLEPLSDTLELARNAEKEAKTVTGKHGLAITVSKRSGVDRTIKGKRVELAARLEQLIQWRRDGAISAGAAYELQELHRILGKSAALEDALIGEALRIIDRKRESGSEKAVDKEKVAGVIKQWLKNEKIKLPEMAYEMIIAGLFASAQDMADGELDKEAIQE